MSRRIIEMALQLDQLAERELRGMDVDARPAKAGVQRANPSHACQLRYVRYLMNKIPLHLSTGNHVKASSHLLFAQGVLWSMGVVSLRRFNHMASLSQAMVEESLEH